ncbi:MAG: TIGR02281 family clan AA aspartic protease [Methylotenera sp.]|nr:TIGR02281 family clan AA aspartic protease [Methylotenera sp.]MDO9233451.1 TIGR02281 family clan AA aspartic protease [Methylotenera sp.]MDO9389074.1 TIGR02281 family clan AA aspartic protease [Methylotenera sp.]MDP2100933.1 TIGR02281 family clan AA aspartic protease [Methylotenera sp.]MDP2282076.1 TIGR02281 family clan AA aspartic protease [Methylotenera sp.]
MLKSLSIVLALSSASAVADTQINVVGLFSNKAVVMIDGGKPKMLSVGQTSAGVKLIAADSKSATFLVEGKTKQLKMGQAASIGGADANSSPSVTLYADAQGHFFSEVYINGAPLKFLVDTGATTVALNSGDAKSAKIDYKRGEPVKVGTANGVVTAYRVTIANLKIGGITLSQVEGSVLEGGSPSVVLLGMSALNRLDMKRQDIALTLTKKY